MRFGRKLAKKVMNFAGEISVVVGIIVRGNRILVNSRTEGQEKAGYWEFPGGKVEVGECDEKALKREMREEIGADVKVKDLITNKSFTWLARRERPVNLSFYICEHVGEEIVPQEGQELAWLTVEEIAGINFLPTNLDVLPALRNWIG